MTENLDETKSNIQKANLFYIESEAALKKPDEHEDKKVNDVDAILFMSTPFDPGINKEPSRISVKS